MFSHFLCGLTGESQHCPTLTSQLPQPNTASLSLPFLPFFLSLSLYLYVYFLFSLFSWSLSLFLSTPRSVSYCAPLRAFLWQAQSHGLPGDSAGLPDWWNSKGLHTATDTCSILKPKQEVSATAPSPPVRQGVPTPPR